MTLSLSGGLGEAETGGAVVNIIPKTGGNGFTGTGFLAQLESGPWAAIWTTVSEDSGCRTRRS